MKKLINALTITLLLCVFSSASAQIKETNLENLSEKERTEYLLEWAKKAVLYQGPDYYREFAPPVIKKHEPLREGPSAGRYSYTISYPYDKTKEIFWGDYIVEVSIWAHTGKVSTIRFGTSRTIRLAFIDGLPEPGTEYYDIIEKIPYMQADTVTRIYNPDGSITYIHLED